MKRPIIKYKGRYNNARGVLRLAENNLFMIEEIDAENNFIVLANYIFNKRYKVPVSDTQIELYANAFDSALDNNMFISVEFDERRGVIVG